MLIGAIQGKTMPPIYNYMYLHVIHNSLYNRYNIVRKDHVTKYFKWFKQYYVVTPEQ